MSQTTAKLRDPSDPEIKIECSQCAGLTAHVALATVETRGGDDHVDWHEAHEIVQCLGCKSLSYRVVSTNSEDFFHDENDDVVYAEDIKLYPPRGSKGLGDLAYYLPQKVRQIYAETLATLSNDSPVLAAIGLRALVETVCKEKEAVGGNLHSNIDSLVSKGVLTPVGASILHRIRTMGNAAAHEVKPHTKSQLALALDIVEHLLKDVFILPRQVEDEFKDGSS